MNVAVFPVPSFDGVQKVFAEAKSHLGEILSAFEFFDKQSVSGLLPAMMLIRQYDLVRRHQIANGEDKKLFDEESDFYCLIETSGSNAEHDEAVNR